MKLKPSLLSEWIPEIVIDIEDVLEALSYYINKNGSRKNIPLSLKRGLAKVLGNSHELFDSYHSQKKGLTLYDAMKILHPKSVLLGYNKVYIPYYTVKMLIKLLCFSLYFNMLCFLSGNQYAI